MLSCAGVLGADANHLDIGNLANQIPIVILVDDGAEFSQQLQRASLIAGVDQLLPIEWIVRPRKRLGDAGIRVQRRVISQFRVMSKSRDGIETQPVNAGIKPEANLSKHGIDDFLIVPVQIGLAAQVMVKIILPAARIPLPR